MYGEWGYNLKYVHLETAAQLTPAHLVQQPAAPQNQPWQGNRYQGRFTRNQGGKFNQHHNQDNFSNFSNKQYLQKKQGAHDLSSSAEGTKE